VASQWPRRRQMWQNTCVFVCFWGHEGRNRGVAIAGPLDKD